MARTPEEIYAWYYTELQGESALADMVPQADDVQTLLQNVTSNSQVAEHRIWLRTYTAFTFMLETLWDFFIIDVLGIVRAARFGTRPWWVEKAKAFQYGYALTTVANFPEYLDTTSAGAVASRIVTRAACISGGGGNLTIKVAKEPVPNEPVALSAAELLALTAYCEQLVLPGVNASVQSLNADRLRLPGAVVRFDPLVMAADGTLISDPSVRPVDVAINAYLRAIPFNGTFSLTAMVDAVQAAVGVVDFTLPGNALGSTAEYGTGAPLVFATFTNNHPTVAGYMREAVSPDSFADTITYVPA